MTKVIFVSAFKSIPAGTELTLSSTGVTYNIGCRCVSTLTVGQIDALVSLGMVRIEEVAERTPFAPKFTSDAGVKLLKAIKEDTPKFFIGEAYSFYNVEKEEWIDSVLLNTASHLGRVVSGFAIPANSSDKKKINRLNNLNLVYGLGL